MILARQRAASQLLHRPRSAAEPADVVRAAGPMQAQEPRAARLAFRARARGLTAADVDRARTDERSLLRAWVMRRTIHLIAAEDAGWLIPLFGEAIVRWSRKRLADFGLDRRGQDRALEVLHDAVDAEGALTRPELAERLERAGFDDRERVQGPPVATGDARRRALPRARSGRQHVPGADRGLDRARSRAARARTRSPSSPDATCARTRRRPSAISPVGPACRCATRGSGSSGSRASSARGPTGCSPSAAARAPAARPSSGCSAPSTTTTSATSSRDFAAPHRASRSR